MIFWPQAGIPQDTGCVFCQWDPLFFHDLRPTLEVLAFITAGVAGELMGVGREGWMVYFMASYT